MANSRFFGVLFTLFLTFMPVTDGEAEVFMTREQALKTAFPDAERIETVTLSLDMEQKIRIEKRARTPVRFSKMKVYTGWSGKKPRAML